MNERPLRLPLLLSIVGLALGPSAHLRAQAPPVPTGGVESEELPDVGETSTAPGELQPPALTGGEAEASQAYAEGDLPKAIAIYRELAAENPETGERIRLRVTAAWLLFESGDRSGAGEELRGALFEQPDAPPREDLYSAEFLALYRDAQAEAAVARTRAATRKLQEGLASSKAGDAAAARVALEESLRLVPRQPRAIHAIAALDLAAGRSDDALAGFQKVLAFDRSTPDLVPRELEAQTLNNIGVIFYSRQQYEDAAEALERAVALAPRDARAWFNLGLARLALGRKIDGMKALERAHELDRADAEISLRLAQLYREASSWIEGVALLVEATRLHPDDPALTLELAWAQKGIGNSAGMMASLARTIELDPQNRTGAALAAARARAEAELAAGDLAAAGADATRATELAPGDGAAWALLGLVRRQEGRMTEAAANLEKAVALDPGRAEYAHNLGTVYLAQKRLVEAEATFRKALTIDPAFAESSAALARLEGARATAPAASSKGERRSAPRELGADVAAVDYEPLGIRGLLVQRVAPGGMAEKSGLRIDDLILRADGKPVSQVATFMNLVRNTRSAAVELSLLRAGKPVEVQLRLN
jgi:tetratricopeptide (TPR) repeat protein